MTNGARQPIKPWFAWTLGVTVLLQTVVYALRPMVSYRALELGASTTELGYITASFAVISLFIAVSIGRWVDRWGEVQFLVAGAAVIALVSLSLLWIENLWALAISQAILGVGHILAVVASQTLVANRGNPTNRDSLFGIFTVAVSLGQLIGPAGAGLLAGSNSSPLGGNNTLVNTSSTFWWAAVLGFAAIAGSCALGASGGKRSDKSSPSRDGKKQRGPFKEKAPSPERESYMAALGRILSTKSMPQAMLVSLSVISAIDILAAYLPAVGEAKGLSVQTVGFLLAVRGLASLASRVLLVSLVSVLGRRLVLILSTATSALSFAAIPLIESTWLIYVLMVVLGFGLGLGQPITLAWVADRASPDLRGTALGVRLTGNRLGQTMIPAVVGVVAGASGLTWVFISVSALLGMSTIAALTADFSSEKET